MRKNGLYQALALIGAGLGRNNYYTVMNNMYEDVYGEHFMLHFPYYGNDHDDLLQGQKNLTDACLDLLPPLAGGRILEVGCGNGVQTTYIHSKCGPAQTVGLDIHPQNVAVARALAAKQNTDNIEFFVGDAQDMQPLKDNFFDVVITIESAMHYPDKNRFLAEVSRVLKPGGTYLIADMVSRTARRGMFFRWMEKRLGQHYWTMDTYLRGFEEVGLSLDNRRDITPEVMRGFDVTRYWFSNNGGNGNSLKWMISVFAKLQIARHCHYLKKHCNYWIFQGKKV
ncbi:MAG: class I SAM-dependent methyltransferase [Spirochaetaceae bacterium]|nr:MAG: class I SAM-dependent methyltransferase [Spirochaetaceae bacterium]